MENIREQRLELERKIGEHHGHIQDFQWEIRQLQSQCKHPNKYQLDKWQWYCPACGKEL